MRKSCDICKIAILCSDSCSHHGNSNALSWFSHAANLARVLLLHRVNKSQGSGSYLSLRGFKIFFEANRDLGEGMLDVGIRGSSRTEASFNPFQPQRGPCTLHGERTVGSRELFCHEFTL